MDRIASLDARQAVIQRYGKGSRDGKQSNRRRNEEERCLEDSGAIRWSYTTSMWSLNQ